MPQRFVIASDDEVVACFLKIALRKMFSDRRRTVITRVNSCRRLRKLRRVVGGPDWLLISQNVPESGTKRIQIAPVAHSSGWLAAKRWVDAKKADRNNRRAVLITDDPWWFPNMPPLSERLTAIPRERLDPDLLDLREILQAGSADVDYLPPTIVNLAVRRRGAAFQLVREDPTFGPLARFFDSVLTSSTRLSQEFKGFRSTSHLWERHDIPKPVPLTTAINRFSTEVTKNGDCLLRRIAAAAHQIVQALTGRACTTDLCCPGPYPVHVHFHWKCQESLQPLDLVRLHQAGVDCLGIHFPVVWRVKSSQAREEDCAGKQTDISYTETGFHVLHSCCREFRFQGRIHDGLSMLPQHSEELILAATASRGKSPSRDKKAGPLVKTQPLFLQPQEAQGRTDLSRLFIPTTPAAPGIGVHITTHGFRANPVHKSGLIVGPANGYDKDNAVVVTVGDLARQRGSSVRFAFLNACELGDQLTGTQAVRNFIGSFAEGMVAGGACAEAICNRWPVTLLCALPLAKSFYATQPLTVHGRAAALLRAKRTVYATLDGGIEAKEEGLNGLSDLSWLAPMHVWWRHPDPSG